MNGEYIIGMGEALWDLLPDGKKIGGAPANFAYHMAQFGYDAMAVSAVGRDALGDEIVANFTSKGLAFDLERVNFPTGTVAVSLDERGIPQYDITEQVAWDNIPYTPQLERIARNARCVCFGSLAQRSAVSRRTINRFIDTMPGNALRVFDINLRQQFYTEEIVRTALAKCNVLKINDEEVVVVSHLFNMETTDLKCVCLHLKEAFRLEIVILTCGENGSYVFYDKGISFLYTPRVEVADTVGAGDSFTAGFCAALLAGQSVPEAHRLAVDTSAFVCSQPGAMPRLPRLITERVAG